MTTRAVSNLNARNCTIERKSPGLLLRSPHSHACELRGAAVIRNSAETPLMQCIRPHKKGEERRRKEKKGEEMRACGAEARTSCLCPPFSFVCLSRFVPPRLFWHGCQCRLRQISNNGPRTINCSYGSCD
jgi:hypothetical protein